MGVLLRGATALFFEAEVARVGSLDISFLETFSRPDVLGARELLGGLSETGVPSRCELSKMGISDSLKYSSTSKRGVNISSILSSSVFTVSRRLGFGVDVAIGSMSNSEVSSWSGSYMSEIERFASTPLSKAYEGGLSTREEFQPPGEVGDMLLPRGVAMKSSSRSKEFPF